jgi:hypothetical protein
MPTEQAEYAVPTVKTLVMLDGGHSTLLKGCAPVDVEHLLAGAIDEGTRFVYLQHHDGYGGHANSVCVDPRRVVALVRVDR